jgi:membrane-associated phospholipid phosphatase
MPSGHAMSAFATAAVLARMYPELAPLTYGLATYVGVARVQQSAHWVSDVIIGATVGTLFGWAAVEINQGSFIARATPSVSSKGASLALTAAF